MQLGKANLEPCTLKSPCSLSLSHTTSSTSSTSSTSNTHHQLTNRSSVQVHAVAALCCPLVCRRLSRCVAPPSPIPRTSRDWDPFSRLYLRRSCSQTTLLPQQALAPFHGSCSSSSSGTSSRRRLGSRFSDRGVLDSFYTVPSAFAYVRARSTSDTASQPSYFVYRSTRRPSSSRAASVVLAGSSSSASPLSQPSPSPAPAPRQQRRDDGRQRELPSECIGQSD